MAVSEVTGGVIRAPWGPVVMRALNDFQNSGAMHPFTCGNEEHVSKPVLVATVNGWVCPDEKCSYTQDWAHAFMANRGIWQNTGLASMLNRRKCTDLTPCNDGKCRACFWRIKALEAGDEVRAYRQQKQKLAGALRILKSPVTVNIEDVTQWLHALLIGGVDITLQATGDSAHDKPKWAVWTGTVETSQGRLCLGVDYDSNEIQVIVPFGREAEFLARVAATNAGWDREENDEE